MKIISGGQTGVDRLALDVAKSLNIATGGTAPKGYLTENGSDFSLKEYGLVESKSSKYPPRTKANVENSDATIYFATNLNSRGLKLTQKCCNELNKNFYLNPTLDELKSIIKNNAILNVAGNRGSNLDEQNHLYFENLLKTALSTLL